MFIIATNTIPTTTGGFRDTQPARPKKESPQAPSQEAEDTFTDDDIPF